MQKPILLVGEAYGANEAKIQAAFVGASGIELLRMLNESGIIVLTTEDLNFIRKYYDTGDPNCIDAVWRMHGEVARTNVFNLHPFANDITTLCGPRAEGIKDYPPLVKSKFLLREYIGELERLAEEIIQINPNLILALGNTPLWAMAGITGISKHRGTTRLSSHTCSGYKLLPTYHPAAVIRQWELRPTTVVDLIKAKREAAFPEIRRPKREIWIEPTLEDLYEFERRFLIPGSVLAVDIETSGNQITCIGFAPHRGVALVIPIYDPRRKGRNYWDATSTERKVWAFISRVLGTKAITKTFQNGLYDIAFLWRSVGIRVYGAEHDTMLLHHALQPESLKGLGYLGSVYCDEGAWKTERGKETTIKRDA